MHQRLAFILSALISNPRIHRNYPIRLQLRPQISWLLPPPSSHGYLGEYRGEVRNPGRPTGCCRAACTTSVPFAVANQNARLEPGVSTSQALLAEWMGVRGGMLWSVGSRQLSAYYVRNRLSAHSPSEISRFSGADGITTPRGVRKVRKDGEGGMQRFETDVEGAQGVKYVSCHRSHGPVHAISPSLHLAARMCHFLLATLPDACNFCDVLGHSAVSRRRACLLSPLCRLILR